MLKQEVGFKSCAALREDGLSNAHLIGSKVAMEDKGYEGDFQRAEVHHREQRTGSSSRRGRSGCNKQGAAKECTPAPKTGSLHVLTGTPPLPRMCVVCPPFLLFQMGMFITSSHLCPTLYIGYEWGRDGSWSFLFRGQCTMRQTPHPDGKKPPVTQ